MQSWTETRLWKQLTSSSSPERPSVEGKRYKLLGPDGALYLSDQQGLFGGHRRGRGYGRMDCRAALRAIAKGGYVQHRVFFADEATAIAAGYRPCAVCLPDRYALWKLACAQADVPRLVRSRARRQPALDIYCRLVGGQGGHLAALEEGQLSLTSRHCDDGTRVARCTWRPRCDS